MFSAVKDLPDAVLEDCAYEAARRGLVEPLSFALRCPKVVAAKVWTTDDIKSCLEDKGFEPSDDNVAAVLGTSDVDDALADCTDGDWEIIYQSIGVADDTGLLQRGE